MRLAAGRTGNQTESLTRPAQRLREPNKLLLHAAGLASGSLHARCEPRLCSAGAQTNQVGFVFSPSKPGYRVAPATPHVVPRRSSARPRKSLCLQL